MTSKVDKEDEEQPLADPHPQAKGKAKGKGKAKRQRAERDAAPQLLFITATDLSQFRDPETERIIRSQVAKRHHPDLIAKQKLRGESSSQEVSAKADTVTPSTTNETPQDMNIEKLVLSGSGQRLQDRPYAPRTASAAWLETILRNERNPDGDSTSWSTSADQGSSQESLHDRVYTTTSTRVISYADSKVHEERHMRMIAVKIAKFHQVGDGVDPFDVLPPFENPELNSMFLLRKCMRAFASNATILKWLPVMLSHKHLLLSSTVLASTWLDMQAGCSGDSRRTTLVKQETFAMFNNRLLQANTEESDATLMVILHMLAGEMWSCNEKALRVHESGIGNFVRNRGGLHCLENQAVADVTVVICYHCDIVCETDALPMFRYFEPAGYTPVSDDTAVPESPLFCPRARFLTITGDSRCSQYTHELLCDMRDLTDLVIACEANPPVLHGGEADISMCDDDSPIDYDDKVAEIRARLVSLPSAYTPGLPTSRDWLYEACRIVALIYTASIIYRVNFSMAAEPAHNPLISKAEIDIHPKPDNRLTKFSLTAALHEVLQKTDTDNVWSDMAGVLYWVCAVGSAAARTSLPMDLEHKKQSFEDIYTVWVRRWLTMYATRTMIVLVFQHPIPVILAQKKLLRVQEIVGARDPQRSSAWGLNVMTDQMQEFVGPRVIPSVEEELYGSENLG